MSDSPKPSGRQPLLGFPEAPKRLEDLDVTPCNAGAISALWRWKEWSSKSVCIVGERAAGKTTMALAWARESGARVLNARDFDRLDAATVASLAKSNVVLDDADQMKNEDNLLTLLNLASGEAAILLTSSARPGRWPVESHDLSSRLAAVATLEIDAPDDDMLRLRLRHAAKRAFMRLPDELVEYLVPRLIRSFAAIEEYVTRLSERVGAENRPPTVPLARDVLAEVQGNDGNGDEVHE